MKIRFLITNAYQPSGGGIIRTTFTLAGALAKRHDVEIVSILRTAHRAAYPVPPGVTLRTLVDRSPGQRYQRALQRISRPSRLIHPRDPRYRHYDRVIDRALGSYLRSLRGGVVVATRVGLNLAVAELVHPSVVRVGQEHVHLGRYGRPLRTALKRSYPDLDLCSVLTEGDAAAFRKLLPAHARVECIPNGLPDQDYEHSENSERVVITAGRLAWQKGYDRLLDAWALVVKQHPDWELRIFGGGPRERSLQQRIDELGIGDQARLMGYTDDLTTEMGAAGFYVMSSRFEGFPMVLLEAMASHLPVVSYDCPHGPRDMLAPDRDGLLVRRRRSPRALATAINKMIEMGAQQRNEMGAAAVAKAERYALPLVAKRWEDLLEELVVERAGASTEPRATGTTKLSAI